MKRYFFSLLLFSIFSSASAISLQDIIDSLRQERPLSANVSYEVLLPTASDPVAYSINFQTSNKPDSLSPCDYLITWVLPRNERESTGFCSYYNGDHFRYRDTRLQEYHYSDDPLPFTSDGGGVQKNAQFADILPAFIAEKLDAMQNDSTYISVFDEKFGTLKGVRRINGYDALEYTYTFSPENGLPIQLDFVYNPASISEQSVTVYYLWDTPNSDYVAPTEEYLITRFSDVFDKFRISNFRVESLRGSVMPSFSYDNHLRERKSHTRGEADLGSPVLLVFLDSRVGSTETTIGTVRTALSSLPAPVMSIYAYAGNDVPEYFELAGNEFMAANPQSIIRKSGVTAFPTFLLIDSQGTVRDVLVGTEQDLSTTLTQSLMLLQ